MDLRLAAVLLLLCATFTISEGGIPRCCVKISQKIPQRLLKHVEKYDFQTSSGFCDIPALVLYMKRKKFCADPSLINKVINAINKRRKQVPQDLFGMIK
ncbi:C-C motif chemokine 28 [Scleropages formosus]|uniref:C-C motif chemokine 28 n=1 Tax=Scleropages formosus TaxID=113540 RepID=UPI0008783C8E|nr:C-C motif chemokine 28 [Scleropages formosus]